MEDIFLTVWVLFPNGAENAQIELFIFIYSIYRLVRGSINYSCCFSDYNWGYYMGNKNKETLIKLVSMIFLNLVFVISSQGLKVGEATSISVRIEDTPIPNAFVYLVESIY